MKTEGRKVQKRREPGACLGGRSDVDGVEDAHTRCTVCAHEAVAVSACHKYAP